LIMSAMRLNKLINLTFGFLVSHLSGWDINHKIELFSYMFRITHYMNVFTLLVYFRHHCLFLVHKAMSLLINNKRFNGYSNKFANYPYTHVTPRGKNTVACKRSRNKQLYNSRW
jgi:hypothetical protein